MSLCQVCGVVFVPRYRQCSGAACSRKCSGRMGGRRRVQIMRAQEETARDASATVSHLCTEQPDGSQT